MKKNEICYILKLFIHILITFFFTIFSYLLSKKNIVLLGSYGGRKMYGNPKYLYKYILSNGNNKKYDIYWVTKNKKNYTMLHNGGKPVIYLYSLTGIVKLLHARYVFIDHGSTDVFFSKMLGLGRFKIIQLRHGIGFKKIWTQDSNNYLHRFELGTEGKKYYAIIASSHNDQQRKEKSFNNQNVIITGSPRNDVFFNPELREIDYKKILGLEHYKKVILYAPTFRDDGIANPFTPGFLDALDTYLVQKNYYLIVKKHINDRSLHIPDSLQNIKDVSKDVPDVQELLLDIDILISDYSGIVTDYVLLGKPVLFYMYDYDTYIENCRDFYYDLKTTLPGPFLYHEDELIKYLDSNERFTTTDYQEKYQNFVDKFHTYKDGNSSERVCKMLGII